MVLTETFIHLPSRLELWASAAAPHHTYCSTSQCPAGRLAAPTFSITKYQPTDCCYYSLYTERSAAWLWMVKACTSARVVDWGTTTITTQQLPLWLASVPPAAMKQRSDQFNVKDHRLWLIFKFWYHYDKALGSQQVAPLRLNRTKFSYAGS